MASHEDTGVQVRHAFERRFEAGETVFEQGDPGETLYIIQSGEVELSRRGIGGPRLVARIGAGDFFGETSVLVGGPRTVRAEIVSDARLLELDASTLEAMCLDRPEVAIRFIRRLASRTLELERRLAALGIDDLLRPLVRVLVRRAEVGRDGAAIPGRLQELAAEAGLSMLDAYHAVHQLLDRKVVRVVDDALVAPDLEALSACLDRSQ
jgi:CRP-like cAMP-binding protein